MRATNSLYGLGFTLAAACSLVNSFDDVKQEPSAQGGSAGSGSGGKAGEAPGGMPPVEGGAPPIDGGGTGGTGGEDVQEPPTTGLVVLGGSTIEEDGLGDGVLTVLDPTSGAVLSSEAISGASLVAIGYDGSTNLWYFFTASSFPADPNSKADLQVRSFNDDSNTWTVVSKVTALPPPQPNGLIVLNDRLAYLSYKIDGGIQNAVTLLDTSNPSKVVPITYEQPDLPGTAIGIVGSRGAPGDDTVLGGTVAVALAGDCSGVDAARACKSLSFVPIFVGDAVSSGLGVDFGAFGGIPGLASARGEQRAFVALPPAASGGNVKIIAFDPRTPSPDEAQLAPSSARWVGGMTFAECEGVAVISTVDAERVFALTSAGLAASAPLGRAGQVVQYDPFTRRLVLPFHPQSSVFPAATGEGGASGAGSVATVDAVLPRRNGANVSLTALGGSDWSPPTDIAVDIVATRYPVSFDCTP